MEADVFTADAVRGAVVSLCAMLIGMVGFGIWQAWRDKDDIVPPRRMPVRVTVVFAIGYLAMLFVAAYNRWEHLGEKELSWSAWMTLVALLINVFALVAIVYFKRDEHTRSLEDIRQGSGFFSAIMKWKMFNHLSDDQRWKQVTGEEIHPGRRRDDRMSPQDLAREVADCLDEDDV